MDFVVLAIVGEWWFGYCCLIRRVVLGCMCWYFRFELRLCVTLGVWFLELACVGCVVVVICLS